MIKARRVLMGVGVGVVGLSAVCVAALCYITAMPGRPSGVRAKAEGAAEAALAGRLASHVQVLSETIGPRYLGSSSGGLERARDYIEAQFQILGYEPRRQDVPTDKGVAHNIEVVIEGTDRATQSVVFGAHYDTEPGTPGADDNASGVAALLELARALRGAVLPRTVRLVAFANEEPPYFQTARMGSVVYANACAARGENVVAMLSLEMLGYYSDEAGSQSYPSIIGWRYPSTGDFVAVVSDLGALSFVRAVVSQLRAQGGMPIEGVSLPSLVDGVWWSDHYAFRQKGYDAAMVTDTALFRNPHYHEKSDTPQTLDYEAMAQITEALIQLARQLSAEE